MALSRAPAPAPPFRGDPQPRSCRRSRYGWRPPTGWCEQWPARRAAWSEVVTDAAERAGTRCDRDIDLRGTRPFDLQGFRLLSITRRHEWGGSSTPTGGTTHPHTSPGQGPCSSIPHVSHRPTGSSRWAASTQPNGAVRTSAPSGKDDAPNRVPEATWELTKAIATGCLLTSRSWRSVRPAHPGWSLPTHLDDRHDVRRAPLPPDRRATSSPAPFAVPEEAT